MSLLLTTLGSREVEYPEQPTELIKWDGSENINLVIDGNSHYAVWVYPKIEDVGNLNSLRSNSKASSVNLAIPGQSWNDMKQSPESTDNAWVEGKLNVLVVGETTNSVFGGSTGSPVRTTTEQVIQDAMQYISSRKLKHDWVILLCGTIPRGGSSAYSAQNALALDVDDYMSKNYKDMGAHGFCDFRESPYFDNDGTSTNSSEKWMGISGLSQETTVPFIHPLGVARVSFANRIAESLQKLELPINTGG